MSGTATKTDTPLIETPQAVSVVTKDQIEQQGAKSVAQALQYTSGVAADTRSAFTGFDIVYSRGFILDRFLDGLRYPAGTGFTPPQLEVYGLERLEVLHGPASMIYGASSPGGIVNAISKRPLDEPYHEIEFTLGNFDHVEAAFDFTGVIDAGKTWSYRLTGLTRAFDSQVDFNESERYFLAPALTWHPSPGTTLTFLGTIQHDPEVGLYSQIPAYGSFAPPDLLPRSRYLGEPAYNVNKRDQQSVGYAFEHTFDAAWTLRQNLRFMHVDGAVDQFLPLPASFGGGLDPVTGELARYALTSTTNSNDFAVDTNAEIKFWTGPFAHNLLLGVDYQRFAGRAFTDQSFGDPINIFDPVYGDLTRIPVGFTTDTDQVLDQTGLYAQDQIKFERVMLTLGIRQDYSDITTKDFFALTRVNQSDSETTYRAGATYLLGAGFAPYASYSTSFQPTVGTDLAGEPLIPTTGEQYEVGLKYEPPGLKALLTVAAYDLTQQNVVTSDPNVVGSLAQIGEVNSRGIEFEGKASITNALDLIGSYTIFDSEITKSRDPVTLGKRPLNIPDQTAALWAFYTFHDGWLNGFGMGGGVRYVGDSAGSDDNKLIVPDYTLFDAAASYDFAKLSRSLDGMAFRLNVRNAFDKTYVSQCTNEVTCVFGTGRTVLGSLKYTW